MYLSGLCFTNLISSEGGSAPGWCQLSWPLDPFLLFLGLDKGNGPLRRGFFALQSWQLRSVPRECTLCWNFLHPLLFLTELCPFCLIPSWLWIPWPSIRSFITFQFSHAFKHFLSLVPSTVTCGFAFSATRHQASDCCLNLDTFMELNEYPLAIMSSEMCPISCYSPQPIQFYVVPLPHSFPSCPVLLTLLVLTVLLLSPHERGPFFHGNSSLNF